MSADDHEHSHDEDHHHDHTHDHGRLSKLQHLFAPHSHDASDSIDDALEASKQGMRALRLSLGGLMGTAILEAVVVAVSGSVALLADTIHNFADTIHNFADALRRCLWVSRSGSVAENRLPAIPMAMAARSRMSIDA